jgi:hypothetical protein
MRIPSPQSCYFPMRLSYTNEADFSRMAFVTASGHSRRSPEQRTPSRKCWSGRLTPNLFSGPKSSSFGMCYGLRTARWSTQPPRKKRWRTMVWQSKKMAPTRIANSKNFTNPSQGDGFAAGSVVFGITVTTSLFAACRQQRSSTRFARS